MKSMNLTTQKGNHHENADNGKELANKFVETANTTAEVDRAITAEEHARGGDACAFLGADTPK